MGRGRESVFVDHYAALGLEAVSSTEEIKSAFRNLAKVLHPDVGGGDALRFHEVYTAYRLLSNADSRSRFDAQYQLHQLRSQTAEMPRLERKTIPLSRLIFPGNMAALARRGLLRKEFRSRDRRFHLKVDYDVELPLEDDEWSRPLFVGVPVIARTICPDCRGSNIHCYACGGRGSYKASRLIQIELDGGLAPGQILEIKLRGLRPAPLGHFKRRTLRIKISRMRHPDGMDTGKRSQSERATA